MTFDELFAHQRLTPSERAALVHHLASVRYRRTVERLLPVADGVDVIKPQAWNEKSDQDWVANESESQ